jgi:hypothetical protein
VKPLASFATDFPPGVSLNDVVNAVLQGAHEWEGDVTINVNEAGALWIGLTSMVAGEEILCELFSIYLLGTDGRVRLVTLVAEALREPVLAEQPHRGVSEYLSGGPIEPLTGGAAIAALEERVDEMIRFDFP